MILLKHSQAYADTRLYLFISLSLLRKKQNLSKMLCVHIYTSFRFIISSIRVPAYPMHTFSSANIKKRFDLLETLSCFYSSSVAKQKPATLP